VVDDFVQSAEIVRLEIVSEAQETQ
jgi:hypothetical protein